MFNLKINKDNKISILDGKVETIEGAEAKAQNVQCRLRTFLGDWVDDKTIGVPYLQYIFSKDVEGPIVEQLITDEIEQVDGVTVDEIVFSLNGKKLLLTVKISIDSQLFTITGP